MEQREEARNKDYVARENTKKTLCEDKKKKKIEERNSAGVNQKKMTENK